MKNIKMIAIEEIHNHPDNPRKDVGDVTELSESIKHSGIMQNLTVVPYEGEYRVIIGHRRLAASKMAGLKEVPCVIVEMSEKEQIATMLSENMPKYIECEALIEKIVNTPFTVNCSGETEEYKNGVLDGLVKKQHHVIDMINEQPAVDVVEIPENGIGELSDGYHTFNELYHHRAILFSVLCNSNPSKAWKSKLHDTGDMYDGMFIVGIETPQGQATYHYDIDPYWDMFKVKELPNAPKWDGHKPQQAIDRISSIAADVVEVRHGEWIAVPSSDLSTGRAYKCSECKKMRYGSFLPNYCQHCGVKMNGKEGAGE